MRLRTFPRRAWRRITGMIRWESRLHAREARRFDRRLGVDTGGWIEPTDLTVSVGDVAEGFTYGGTQARLVRWCFDALPPDRSSFTFVDMGSGKGRVLLYAAEAGFGRSLGVEFAEELHSVALANAEIAKRRSLSIEPVLGDAGAFEFPDEPLVVYFNNPFSERVMERVIANLSASYERAPRPVIVLYQQLIVEWPAWQRTRNLELLEQVSFLTGRTLEPPKGPIDRRMLKLFVVGIYESPEVKRPS